MPFATRNKRKSRWGAASNPTTEAAPYDVSKVNRQIENSLLRIQDAGYDVQDADRRNWFERATNLPEGQNWFFDALELLNRPGQAVLGGLQEFQAGEKDIGKIGRAAWEGFSGQRRTRGSELVRNAGVENKALQAILGTGAEILLDPLSFTPTGAVSKGLGTVARGTGRFALKGYEAAEKASPAFERVSRQYIRPAAEGTKDALGYMFNRDYKLDETLEGVKDDTLKRIAQDSENTRRYLQEESLKTVADAAKRAGGIETGEDVGRIMEAPLRQFEEVKGYEFPDGIRRTTDKYEILSELEQTKKRIRQSGQEERALRRDFERAISETVKELDRLDSQIRRAYFSRENAALRRLNARKKKPENVEEMAQQIAMSEVSASPKLNLLLQQREEVKKYLDDLRAQSTTAREGKISEIKRLNDEAEALRESLRNPVTIQREIPRPERELSSDPNIRQAAQTLIQSNQFLREYAASKGIDIPELEGYMTHVLSAAERELRKQTGKTSGAFPSSPASKNILKQRELMGSAEDINERIGRRFFEPNAYFATAIGQKRLIDYIQAVDFRRQVLSNPNFARPIKEGEKVVPGKNQAIINVSDYKFIKEGEDILEGAGLADQIGGKYLVTKAVKNALDRYQRLNTDEGTKAFIKAFDAATNTWKKLALFSVGYHIRNFVGGMFNNYVGGMNTASLVRYTSEAIQEVTNAVRGKESQLFNEYRRQGLGSSALSNVEFLRSTDPEKAIEKTVRDRISTTPVLDRLNPLRSFETSREAGDFIDQVNRFALYKWARDKGMTPEQAATKVREIQFDYTRLSPFEQKAVRLIPFYRWMRNNIPFQLQQFIADPKKYANVNKIRLNAQEVLGIDEQSQPDYMKENFAFPVYGRGDGTGLMLGLNLPLSDLPKISDPLKILLDSLTPLAKLPAELSLNRSFFYDRPIEQFEGQRKQFAIPENILGIPIPGGGTDLPSAIEPNMRLAYLIEQLGAQPVRTLANLLTAPESEDQAKKFSDPVFGINSLLKEFDVNRAEYFEQREQLQKLLDLIKFIEQQTGQEVRTVNEIRRGS